MIHVCLYNFFSCFGLHWYAKYIASVHANNCKGIPVTLLRWGLKFTNQIHGDKLHGLSSSFKMSFLELYLCNVVFGIQLTSFTMWLYVSFHTYPIVELSDCCIHPGEPVVSTMIMSCHENVIYHRSWQYYWSKLITCNFHDSSFEGTIFNQLHFWWQITYL